MNRRCALVIALLLLPLAAAADERWEVARTRMIRDIDYEVRLTSREIGRTRFDDRVMAVLGSIDRHEFVPADQRRFAYDNRPLPIGHGQTISQPYIVALMTDLLDIDRDDVVLEVGTGSGYQAAVLSRLAREVYSIEIVPPLATSAAARLERLGFDNVRVRQGDGYYGWKERAPFDAIIVTAASSHIPPPLVAQLAPGGIMIIPVGGVFSVQYLMLVTKGPDDAIRTRQILPVRFVPLTGEH